MKKPFAKFSPGTKYEDIDAFFKWSHISANLVLIDSCIDYENIACDTYSSYFGPLKEIAEKAGLAWQHIDLFLYKKTDQEKLMNLIREKGKLNQFALDQIALFKQVFAKIEPCCLIVINAKASEILRGHFNDDLAWDDRRGFHWLRNETPIFFSSMLIRGALDRWSYERLMWHISLAARKPNI